MLSSYAEMEDAVGNEEWEQINQPEVRKRVQNRLSQRRHSECPRPSSSPVVFHPFTECFTQGEKVRHQREPVTQELMIPPSYTSTYTMDGAPAPTDYPSPSVSFNGQDDRTNLISSSQAQEGYDAFESFNAQDMLPPDQTVPNVMAQHAQPGSAGMRRSMTPHVGRPTMNNSFQPNNMRPLGTLVSGPQSVPADSRNEYWDSQPLPDPQWAIPAFHQNSIPVSNPAVSTVQSRPASSSMHRPMAKSMPRRTSSASSNQQLNTLPAARTSDSYSSPVQQRNINQIYPQSNNHHENANTESENTRNKHDTCSHCRSCRAPNTPNDQRPGRTSPKTPSSTPSQNSSQASSPDHHDILANCSKVLADLARQSEYRDGNEHEQRPKSSKRNKSNEEGYFVDGSGSSQEDDYGESHRRRNVFEKVVILCVNNGRKTKT